MITFCSSLECRHVPGCPSPYWKYWPPKFPLGTQIPKNPPKQPLLLRHVDLHLIHQCLGPPHSPPQTPARSLYAPPHGAQLRNKGSIGYNGTPQIHPQKLPLRRSPPKSNSPITRPTPLTTPNGIQIQSAVSSQFTFADRPTDRLMVHVIKPLPVSHEASAAV